MFIAVSLAASSHVHQSFALYTVGLELLILNIITEFFYFFIFFWHQSSVTDINLLFQTFEIQTIIKSQMFYDLSLQEYLILWGCVTRLSDVNFQVHLQVPVSRQFMSHCYE